MDDEPISWTNFTVDRWHLKRELVDWHETRFAFPATNAVALPRPSRLQSKGSAFPDRDAEICRRVAKHENMTVIAKDHGLTRERVRQIAKRAGLTGFNPCKGCGKGRAGGDHCGKCRQKLKRWGSLEKPKKVNKGACTCGKCAPGKQARCYVRRLYAENPERRARIAANNVAWQKKVMAEGGEKAERLRQKQREASKRWAKRHPERAAEAKGRNAERRRERWSERYAGDPGFRAAELKRRAACRQRHKAFHEERMKSDSEYATRMREKWRAAYRRATKKKEEDSPSDTPL